MLNSSHSLQSSGAADRSSASPRNPYDPAMCSHRLAARPLTEPHPDRLAPEHPLRAEMLARHAAALAAGDAGYWCPGSGLFVLTAEFLAERGTCCDQGCRHCPYVE
jgi:hypothetical protein